LQKFISHINSIISVKCIIWKCQCCHISGAYHWHWGDSCWY